MKFKLGQKYYYLNGGDVQPVGFFRVDIIMDLGGIYTSESYYDNLNRHIVSVHNREKQELTTPIFKSESKALDYLIRKLKQRKANT